MIPKQQHDGQVVTFFEKLGQRKAQTIAKASLALRGWLGDGRLTHVRVAVLVPLSTASWQHLDNKWQYCSSAMQYTQRI
jgi:hypothetical protein